MIETTFILDSLGQNVVYTEGRAKFAQIYRLICMNPGTDVLYPEKGVGINSYRYSFKENSTLRQLEQEIEDQISKYTPYEPSSINCESRVDSDGNNIIVVIISLLNIDETIVVLSNGSDTAFDTLRT